MTAFVSLPAGLKEIDPIGYIGIDFGTCNSHFAYCDMHGLRPEPIRLGGKLSQQTCVLWKYPFATEKDIVAYGTLALQEWSMLNDDERALHAFVAAIKPDLVSSELARRNAWAFFRKAYVEMSEAGVVKGIGVNAGVPVVVGVPAEIGPEYVRLTAELAQSAGFGPVSCIPEPLGALAYHLANNDLTLQEAREGVVVVDFGGGTLDVAVADERGLRQPSGDPLLGGRLFDDLFFQWLLDQHPTLKIKDHDFFYIWAHSCRELKEAFSRRWAQVGTNGDFQDMVRLVDRLVPFRKASVAQFQQRARHYKPSAQARAHFKLVGGDLAELGVTPIDLFAWIRATLAEGTRGQTFRRVLLTGGSCDWPFMKPLAAVAFDVPINHVIRSKQSETTVGSGLALYRVLCRRLEKTRHLLGSHKPRRKQAFEEVLDNRLGRFVHEIPDTILGPLMAEVEPVFVSWYHQGGSLADVEKRVELICREGEPRLREVLEAEVARLGGDVLLLMRGQLQQWLAEHNIQRDVDTFLPPDLGSAGRSAQVGTGVADGLAEPMALAFAASLLAMLAAVTVVVKMAVMGALLPLLLTPVGVVIAIVAVVLGTRVAQNMVKGHDWGSFPGKLDLKGMHLVLSEATLRQKLAESRDKAREKLASEIRQALDGMRNQAVARFEEVIDQVVADLRVLEQTNQVRA
jgi:hypothetical protein